MPRKTLIGLVGSLALWISGILGSFALLQKYSSTPGRVEQPGSVAHAVLADHRTPGRPLVAMAVHPLCPCTQSSLAELSDLLARSHGACDAVLIQFQPLNGTPEWPVDDSPRK